MSLATILGWFAKPIVVPIAVALIRSIAGWLENAAKDGNISHYEWKMLVSTFFRTAIQSVPMTLVGGPALGYCALVTDTYATKLGKKE